MTLALEKLALVLLLPAVCLAQPLTPAETLHRYLSKSYDARPGCSDLVFAVQIDASLPQVRKQGSMRGIKVVSRSGKIVYRGLRFTGDNLIKTAVIARFLASETDPPESAADTGVTNQNYWLAYDNTASYNGLVAHVYRLRPKRKQVGLLKGELWLDAQTAEPLRLWGDVIKSPSIFIHHIRVVEDYQSLGACSQPLRLLVTARTRIAGAVEMAVWQRLAEAAMETGESASHGSEGWAQSTNAARSRDPMP
jgi:hypothetical protein